MWLNRLPPDYGRRYYVNLGIIVALVIFVTNVGRLGQRNAAMAVLSLMALGFAYLCIWPIVSLLRAKPRPGLGAFFLTAAYIIAFAYAFASFFLPVPASSLAFLAGFVALWSVLIWYRGIVFPSLFGRDGRTDGSRERFGAVREAQRASRAETEALIASLRDER